MILAGLLTASRKTERRLKDENIVCFGAGESMLGFAHLVVETLKRRCKMTTEDAKQRLFLVDSRGLLVKNRSLGGISKEKEPFCRPEGTPELRSLIDVSLAILPEGELILESIHIPCSAHHRQIRKSHTCVL